MPINDEIREREVRVVGKDGEALGVMSGKDALALADKENLDLVMIAPQGKPPVCKVMDYGKYRFEQSKRDKDLRKNQQQTQLKEVRLTPNIDINDFNTKVSHALKFLKAGDKVKVTVRFRGREVTHADLGEKLVENFKEAVSEYGAAEKAGKLEGKFFTVVIAPKAEKPQKKAKDKNYLKEQ